MHATSIALFTHLHTDMGEAVHAKKFAAMLPHVVLYDIPEILQGDYAQLAHMNLALADLDYEPCVSARHHFTHKESIVMILSWGAGVAAMLATGLHETYPTITKLYAHQPQERILTKLYQSSRVLITESLLASERARAYGLENVLYIPHHFTHQPAPSRQYVTQLAKRLGKSLPTDSVIVGLPSRLEYWKNCEFAVEAVRYAHHKHPLVLVVKGDFPQQTVYPHYTQALHHMLTTYQDEPWLLWDRTKTPYPQVLQEYASFDFCLQPSGAEGASNVIVELMAMGKPVIVLEASSQPYLFREGAIFVPPQPELRQAQLSYAQPQIEGLIEAIERLCCAQERAIWSRKAREVAEARFHPQQAQRKIDQMFQAVAGVPLDFNRLEQEDRAQYGL